MRRLATVVTSTILAIAPLGVIAPPAALAAETCAPPTGAVKVCVDAARDGSDEAYVDASVTTPGAQLAHAHASAGLNDSGHPYVSGYAFAPDGEHGAAITAFTLESSDGDPGVEVAVNLLTDYKVNVGVVVSADDPLSKQQLCLSNDQNLLPPRVCLLPLE